MSTVLEAKVTDFVIWKYRGKEYPISFSQFKNSERTRLLRGDVVKMALLLNLKHDKLPNSESRQADGQSEDLTQTQHDSICGVSSSSPAHPTSKLVLNCHNTLDY